MSEIIFTAAISGGTVSVVGLPRQSYTTVDGVDYTARDGTSYTTRVIATAIELRLELEP